MGDIGKVIISMLFTLLEKPCSLGVSKIPLCG